MPQGWNCVPQRRDCVRAETAGVHHDDHDKRARTSDRPPNHDGGRLELHQWVNRTLQFG